MAEEKAEVVEKGDFPARSPVIVFNGNTREVYFETKTETRYFVAKSYPVGLQPRVCAGLGRNRRTFTNINLAEGKHLCAFVALIASTKPCQSRPSERRGNFRLVKRA